MNHNFVVYKDLTRFVGQRVIFNNLRQNQIHLRIHPILNYSYQPQVTCFTINNVFSKFYLPHKHHVILFLLFMCSLPIFQNSKGTFNILPHRFQLLRLPYLCNPVNSNTPIKVAIFNQ